MNNSKFLLSVSIGALLSIFLLISGMKIFFDQKKSNEYFEEQVGTEIAEKDEIIYFSTECLAADKKSETCNKKFLTPLINYLDSKGIKETKQGLYQQKEIKFKIQYYAGLNSFCLKNVCQSAEYVVKINITSVDQLLASVDKIYSISYDTKKNKSIFDVAEDIESNEIMHIPGIRAFISELSTWGVKKRLTFFLEKKYFFIQ